MPNDRGRQPGVAAEDSEDPPEVETGPDGRPSGLESENVRSRPSPREVERTPQEVERPERG